MSIAVIDVHARRVVRIAVVGQDGEHVGVQRPPWSSS